MTLVLDIRTETCPLREPFELARGTLSGIDMIVVELTDAEGHRGRGEAPGLPYEGESPTSMTQQLREVAPRLRVDMRGEELLELMPRGGARNALDCALWDLKAKRAGHRAWQLVGMSSVNAVCSAITLGLGSDADFRRRIRAVTHMPIIKIKADRTRHLDLAQIAREEHPNARLIMDANQSWDRILLDELVKPLQRIGVELIEQPVPKGEDQQLAGYTGALPLAADESCTDRASLATLGGLYQYVSIKLDKCGGLTEGLALATAAQTLGLGLMVGNMGGTSLSMAPHFLVAQRCAYVDLDAPLIFKTDRTPAMNYDGAYLQAPDAKLWG